MVFFTSQLLRFILLINRMGDDPTQLLGSAGERSPDRVDLQNVTGLGLLLYRP